MKKTLLLIALFVIALFLLTPAVSLVLTRGIREHSYRNLMLHVIAAKESKSERSKPGAARKIMFYTARNTLLNPGDVLPYDGKALDYLINGLVYCDYQADIFASLCAQKGIHARYCMLMDKNGVSPHTVAEAKLAGKWMVFDIAEGCLYADQSLAKAELQDLSKNPGIIFNNKRWLKLKNISEEAYNNKVNYYSRMFPVPYPPQRSASKLKKITVFDRIIAIHYDIFGSAFLRAYQNYYLEHKVKNMEPAEKLYYYARNYQLAYRNDEAIQAYNQLLANYKNTPYFNRSVIFLALTLMDQKQDYARAIKALSLHLNGLGGPYEKYALYYTGQCYGSIGEPDRASRYINESGMSVALDPELAN